ncbi:MAG TPA: PP2C family protein-serine/threonine phosphatase [Thermoanaerobaculia bacterium]|nr:PP2C family protein-serine/threonine phosphatase [Thermoanaerobaculia bacterium]
MAKREEHPIRRLRAFVREATEGLRSEDFRRLFDQDAASAFEALTRDQAGQEPRDRVTRFFERARLLLVGIAFRLSPARRLLFGLSLLAALFGLLDLEINLSSKASEGWKLVVDTSSFWSMAAIGGLFLLLTLELVDKLRVRDEIELARTLQHDLLPKTDPPLPGWHFAHSSESAAEVGGDSFDLYPLPDGRLALFIADASGHGMGAGLVMAIAHSTIRTALDVEPTCARVHGLLNRTLCRTGDRRNYLTLFFALLDPATGLLEYFLAGHPFPLLRRADGSIVELGRGSLPLGLKDPLPVLCEPLQLAPGDLLLLYTDGLPEAIDPTGNAFSFPRVAELLAAGGDCRAVHERVQQALAAHLGGEPLRDDVTLLLIEREAPRPPLPV